MSYQEAINQEIGNIIKQVQYIEWNLLSRLGMDTFEAMTLGQIIGLIRSKRVIHQSAIDELEKILERRNDLVHVYFKRKDFEKHAYNEAFLDSELRYLRNFSNQVNNFNNWLVSQKLG